MQALTLDHSISMWLETIRASKSRNTWRTYKHSAKLFRDSIGRNIHIDSLSEKQYEKFVAGLKGKSPKTEKLHATSIGMFYLYLSAKGMCKVNTDSITYIRHNETRRVPKRLRKMDYPSIEYVAEKVTSINPKKSLIVARAKAFVTLLCRSGLRAFEAGSLRESNLDRRNLRGTVIGKGNKEAYFLIDDDILAAIDEYKRLRKTQSDYLFISHSRRDNKPRPIETDTARRDVMLICNLILENEPTIPITPHQFRHFFVTSVYRETGDIVEAQTLARHENIDTTKGYIHQDESDIERAQAKLRKKRK